MSSRAIIVVFKRSDRSERDGIPKWVASFVVAPSQLTHEGITALTRWSYIHLETEYLAWRYPMNNR
jgi:hypothetical protein